MRPRLTGLIEATDGFYSQLKELDKYLRFTFVTGLTRFGMTGLTTLAPTISRIFSFILNMRPFTDSQ
jgi:hypothetical protein